MTENLGVIATYHMSMKYAVPHDGNLLVYVKFMSTVIVCVCAAYSTFFNVARCDLCVSADCHIFSCVLLLLRTPEV